MTKKGLFFISDYRNVTCESGRDPSYWILKGLDGYNQFRVYSTANNVINSSCFKGINFLTLGYKGSIQIQKPGYNYAIYKAYQKVMNKVEIIHHCEKFQVGKGYNLIPLLSDVSDKSMIIGPVHFPHIIFENDYLAETSGIKRILNKSTFKNKNHLNVVFKILFKNTIIKSDKVIVPNKQVKDKMKKYVSSKKLRIINYGVDLSLYRKYEYKADENNFRILFPSMAIERKGAEYLLEAIYIIKKEIPGVKLYLLSEGYKINHYKKISKQFDIDNNVIFCGKLKKDEYLELLSNCKLMCQPTLSDSYGWTVLDAMCLGVPVVTTEKCGCPDLFENGEIGIRVKPKDSHLLAEAIIKLFNDYELCKKFSRAGINKRDDYDYNKIAKEYLNLYEEYS
ncbi:Glycosyltransferase involved in cell wall bisynthesis [Candidatus Methanomarinus sp.]|nr:Glycosyltransferase involved in cell wall bisynthesis [ANME-2 cluster archaeon]